MYRIELLFQITIFHICLKTTNEINTINNVVARTCLSNNGRISRSRNFEIAVVVYALRRQLVVMVCLPRKKNENKRLNSNRQHSTTSNARRRDSLNLRLNG